CSSLERLKPHSPSSAHTYRLLVFKEHCAMNLLRCLLAFLRAVIQREANYAGLFRCRQAPFSKKFRKSGSQYADSNRKKMQVNLAKRNEHQQRRRYRASQARIQLAQTLLAHGWIQRSPATIASRAN
ncbi:hypothetical protein, partial [Caballeronia catudaia]|uniref:hypothetical protein n=1 Tax=Caballeronia catudaia TaxID=1777136 RepID=UPI001F226915